MIWLSEYWNWRMWDNHQALGSLANSLFALTALMASYFISKWIINLPLLPLKEPPPPLNELLRVLQQRIAQIARAIHRRSVHQFAASIDLGPS